MLKETRGAIKKDNKYYCEKCGADLSKDNSVHFVAHGDGRETYSYMYQCNKCDNRITQVYERDETSKKFWS